MNMQQVLRPVDTKRIFTQVRGSNPDPGAFNWVHLDKEGLPLCGEEYDLSRYNFRIEQLDLDDDYAIREYGGSHVCRSCASKFYDYEVKTLQSGQSKPYASSIYRYHITDLTGKRERDEVAQFAIRHVKFAYWQLPDWHLPKIEALNRSRVGEWIYRVTMAYTG